MTKRNTSWSVCVFTVLAGLGCAGARVVPVTAGAQANPIALPPIDEASQDPSFSAFRNAMLAAVRRRDVVGVTTGLHDRLATGLVRSLNLKPSLQSPSQPEDDAWDALDKILTMGGTFITAEQRLYGRGYELGEKEFCAPYVFSAFPRNPPGLGSAIGGVLLQKDVGVREKPSESSGIVTRRSFEVVKFAPRYPDGRISSGWTPIEKVGGAVRLRGIRKRSQRS